MGLLLLALLSCALAASSTSVPLPLAPGVEMPIVGLGTGSYGQLAADGSTTYGEYWNDTVAERAVAAFIAAGGRRLDCSLKWYHDLAGVGRGMAASGLPREQLFVTSKVDDPFGYSEALASVRASLAMLNTSYVDLVLMHWPAPMAWDFETTAFDTRLVYNQSCGTPAQCRVATVRGLQEALRLGLVRAVGVANFELRHLQDLLDAGLPLPAVNQLEFHPFWHQDEWVVRLQKLGIVVNGYSPLGAPDYMACVKGKWPTLPLEQPAVLTAAAETGKTAAQVVLRWQLQKGLVVNPRTVDPQHMADNLDIFDFELSEAQMAAIDSVRPPLRPKVCPDPFLLA